MEVTSDDNDFVEVLFIIFAIGLVVNLVEEGINEEER